MNALELLLIVALVGFGGLVGLLLLRGLGLIDIWRGLGVSTKAFVIAGVVLTAMALIISQGLPRLGEILLCVSMFGLAFSLFLWSLRIDSRRSAACGVVASGVVVVSMVSAIAWNPVDDAEFQNQLPRQVEREDFVSSRVCRTCHPRQYASWHKTYHRTMTQIASPQTVRASFDNVELNNRQRRHRLERRGDEYWVRMPDPDWERSLHAAGYDLRRASDPPMVERRVLMITGSHHLQSYWVGRDESSELHMLPFYYHIKQKRWIPNEDSSLCPPDSPPIIESWNRGCIKCHTTAGNPGLQVHSPNAGFGGKGLLESEVVEFGISCEACHGPAEQHVRFHCNPLNRYQRHFSSSPDPTILNPKTQSSRITTEICGQCHSYFVARDPKQFLVHGLSYRAGGNLQTSHRIMGLDQKDDQKWNENVESVYWSDGACRVGGDEYNGLVESPCYQNGTLSCLSCHSMHDSDPNDQLAARMGTNHACTQCHSESQFVDSIERHTHHPPDSVGSRCYNCHMPFTAYALFTAMRSHRIDSPTVTSADVQNGRPNACNLCHLDQTLQWTRNHLSNWYGIESDDLNDDESNIAASLLWLLRGDAAQRLITAWHMGWNGGHSASGNDWQAPFLAEMLQDPYSVVRYVAHHSLRQLPGFDKFEFNFIAPPDDRTAKRQQALDTWQRTRTSDQTRGRAAVLLSPEGRLDQQTINRLIEQRNAQPVRIPE